MICTFAKNARSYSLVHLCVNCGHSTFNTCLCVWFLAISQSLGSRVMVDASRGGKGASGASGEDLLTVRLATGNVRQQLELRVPRSHFYELILNKLKDE